MLDSEPAPGVASIYPRVFGGLGRRRPKVGATVSELDARRNELRVIMRFNDYRTDYGWSDGRDGQAVLTELTGMAGLEF